MVFFKGCNQGELPRAREEQTDRNLIVCVHLHCTDYLSVCLHACLSVLLSVCVEDSLIQWKRLDACSSVVLPGTERHVRHLKQVGLWVHRASLLLWWAAEPSNSLKGPVCKIHGQKWKVMFIIVFFSVYNSLKIRIVLFLPHN